MKRVALLALMMCALTGCTAYKELLAASYEDYGAAPVTHPHYWHAEHRHHHHHGDDDE